MQVEIYLKIFLNVFLTERYNNLQFFLNLSD